MIGLKMYSDNAVRIKRNIIISPRCDVFCEGVKEYRQSFNRTVEVGVRDLVATRLAVKNQNDVPLKLINVSEEELNLAANTIVGYEECISEIMLAEAIRL